MISESLRIADQLRRAFSGDAWHGLPIHDILKAVTAEQASIRAVTSAHTIWELVLHIDIYSHAALQAVGGTPIPPWYGTGQDWTVPGDVSQTAWKAATSRLFENAELLAKAIEQLDDSALDDIVPGRGYNFYHLFHGIVQHSLYHAGQIALLKKALSSQ